MRACLATGLPLWMEIILFVLRWGGVAGELLPQGATGVSTQVFLWSATAAKLRVDFYRLCCWQIFLHLGWVGLGGTTGTGPQ